MRSLLLILICLILLIPLAPAHAFDLTGTWTGKYTCKGTDGTKFSYSVSGTLEITQTGSQVAMRLPFQGGADAYNGVAIDDVRKPEQGGLFFAHCGISDIPGTGLNGFDESGFASIKTKSTGKGSLKGTTAYYYLDPPPGAANCKWSYKRTSTTDPQVPACDQ